MAEPRLSSAGRNLPAFQGVSESKPNQQPEGVPPGHRVRVREGYGSSSWKPTPDDRPRFEVRKAKEIEWAERHLPGEHLTFVVTAMDMLKLNKQPVSVKSVMARLESTGRTMAQLKQKGWA
jgi:hypothetical protein